MLAAKHSRASDGGKVFAKELSSCLVEFIVIRFELVVDLIAAKTEFAELPTLRLQSKRPRRVAMGKKVQVVGMAAATPGVSNVTTFVAAERALCKRRLEPLPVDARSAARFVKSVMYQYWLSCRELFHNRRHVAISCDAARVAGDDLMSMAYISTEANCGCWGPPQVPKNWLKTQFSKTRRVSGGTFGRGF